MCHDCLEKNAPSNCRWATGKEQGRNKRNNRILTLAGETRCMSEWAEILGLKSQLIHKRLKRGWSDERTLTEPIDTTHHSKPEK